MFDWHWPWSWLKAMMGIVNRQIKSPWSLIIQCKLKVRHILKSNFFLNVCMVFDHLLLLYNIELSIHVIHLWLSIVYQSDLSDWLPYVMWLTFVPLSVGVIHDCTDWLLFLCPLVLYMIVYYMYYLTNPIYLTDCHFSRLFVAPNDFLLIRRVR